MYEFMYGWDPAAYPDGGQSGPGCWGGGDMGSCLAVRVGESIGALMGWLASTVCLIVTSGSCGSGRLVFICIEDTQFSQLTMITYSKNIQNYSELNTIYSS